mmetsp:Transcript_108642/g.192107  ORF Transcript_108642/g.192107 Transcript_108642/m.192107 type:complete len:1017 (+) Transcript_108642:137-3187(+)
MSAVIGTPLDLILSLQAPLWVELLFVSFFGLGFALVRNELFPAQSKVSIAKKAEALQMQWRKAIEVEVGAGHMAAAIKAWRRMKSRAHTPLETLKLVVQAMLEVEPTGLVKEIVDHIADHREVLCNTQTAAIVLGVISRAGNVTLMEELRNVLDDRFGIHPSTQIYEVLLSGYASVGDEKQVSKLCAELRTGPVKISAKGYSLTIKGFLKKGMVDAALRQVLDMHRAAFIVPPLAVTQLIRESCEEGRGIEIFQTLHKEVAIPPEAACLLLEECCKRGDLSQARHIEQFARQQSGSLLPIGGYEALLKNCVLNSDLYAMELFEEMQRMNIHISEGLCVRLLTCCADSKFLRFAEDIAAFLRARSGMTMAIYSALMKVYAYTGMYGKACDLYDQIVAQGLEPDTMMYGCLMKFAVQCGRTDLSRDLFNKAPRLEIQNYVSLIKAAGREKNIEQAFEVLQKMKDSSMTPDIAAYSCVLDVCVTAGDLRRARALMAEMRTIGKLDVVTYNILLKGYCSCGDISGAKELLSEMEGVGIQPNDVSFNCLINAAASRGFWEEAWNTIEIMQRSGVQVDNFTVSIMMKALKVDNDSKHVSRVLALLDRWGLDVCSDEVLLRTVLESCIRHHEHTRLESVVDAFSKSSIQPNVQTYGSLIKAYGALKRVDDCWNLWYKMVDDRALEPNDVVVGCMLDALVCNEYVEEAVTLFKKWQPKVKANTIIFSTLIKGFACSRQVSRAMDMWREMQELRMPLNNKVYNALIDAHARVGAMEEVRQLVQGMATNGCKPDNVTYSTIVKGYCFNGNLDEAFEVWQEIRHMKMANISVICNILFDGSVRHNRMDIADVLLSDIERFGIALSNVSLGIMVKMYGRRKQLQRAFDIVEDIPRKHGFEANAQVKTCLMSACFYNHELELAVQVFEELRSSKHGADSKMYAAMISGALRHGWIEQAVTVVEDAYGLNAMKALPADHVRETDTLEQLLRALIQRGEMARIGVPLLNRIRAAHIPVSGRVLSLCTSSSS